MLVRCDTKHGLELLPLCGIRRPQIFELTEGKSYHVHGMALWRGCLTALLLNDNGWAQFVPVSMFTVIDPTVPKDWFFSSTVDCSEEPWVQAIWGYEQLVSDPTHYERLLDGDSEEIQNLWNLELACRKAQAELNELRELDVK